MTSNGPFPLQLLYDLIVLGPDIVYLLANLFIPFYEKKLFNGINLKIGHKRKLSHEIEEKSQ